MMALERIIYTVVIGFIIWILWYAIRGLQQDNQKATTINVPPKIDVTIKKDETKDSPSTSDQTK